VQPGRTYWYHLVLELADGVVTLGPLVTNTFETSPTFELERVAPSPTSGPVTIAFSVAREAKVRLSIIDVQGRRVAVLVEGTQRPGRYQAVWNGAGEHGLAIPGLYFVMYETPGHRSVKRIVVNR